MKAKGFDKNFDDGENLLKHLDLTKAKRPGQDQKRVNVDFPIWMIQRPCPSIFKILFGKSFSGFSNRLKNVVRGCFGFNTWNVKW